MQIISLLPLSVPIHHLHYPFLKQAKNKKRFKKNNHAESLFFYAPKKKEKTPLFVVSGQEALRLNHGEDYSAQALENFWEVGVP